MELDENGKVDVSLFPGSRSIAASIMQRPAYDAGSTKRPLLLEPIVGSGSDDDGLDFVSASFNEIVEKGKTIHGLDAEAELAAIIAAEIKTELAKHKTQWDELADAWVAVVSNPSLQNLQALKWYFGEWAFNEEENSRAAGAHLSIQYDKASTTVTMELDGWVHTTTFEKSLDDLIVGSESYDIPSEKKPHSFDNHTAAEAFDMTLTPERVADAKGCGCGLCTEWLAEKKVMVSPGICIYDTCGWIEGWGKVEGESHEDYHRWHSDGS